MADFYISYINPIRFRRDITPNDMTRIDEMANQTQYYKGVYPLEYYTANWKLGEEIVIQIQTDLSYSFARFITLVAYTDSGTTVIEPTFVTPTGWTSGLVMNYTYTPPSNGEYYFKTATTAPLDDYISDIFYVSDNEMNLVEFKYYDTENRYSGVFYDNDTLIWQPKAYFTGIQTPGEPQNEYSIYTDESNEPRKIQSEPNDTIQIDFTDITKRHIKQLNRIFSCDTIFVNSQPVENTENIKIDVIPGSDAMNANINLIETSNDGFVKNY